ncbi:class I mannose-6-phosphate isomerase [bacterium]|nr:class I mannose-6-phosphate isomerase [bacterium]
MAGREIYPLKVSYTYHPKIWGGRSLAEYVAIPEGLTIGEVSLVSDGEPGSIVLNGPFQGTTLRSVCRSLARRLVGRAYNPDFPERFPLVLKLIHSQRPLSIQVHPDDQFARTHERACSGKTEAWYILEADDEATIKVGFVAPTTKETILEAIREGYLEKLLGTYTVKPGETFFLPPGQIHSLGAGVVLAEIQQNTLVTYRLYDFNRIDPATGRKRELDIDKAMQVIDLTPTSDPHTRCITVSQGKNVILTFVACRSFCGQKINLHEPFSASTDGTSFDIVFFESGTAQMNCATTESDHTLDLKKGDTIIIPAELGQYSIQPTSPNTTLFKFFMPDLAQLQSYFIEKGFSRSSILELNGFGPHNDFPDFSGK